MENNNVVVANVKEDQYKCAVCQLRQNGICEFCTSTAGSGTKCDGILRTKKEMQGMIIDQNLICLKTKGNYRTCIIDASCIDKLINGNSALMIGNVAVIFNKSDNKEEEV